MRSLALLTFLAVVGSFARAMAAEVSLPAAPARNGGSVVIVSPMDATPLVRWLNERGLAAWGLPASANAADVTRSIRELRARAGELALSPARIALLGFSHGADVAAEIAYQPGGDGDDAARPNLVALIWPTRAAPALGNASQLPPTFLVGSTRGADNAPAVDLWQKLEGRGSNGESWRGLQPLFGTLQSRATPD